MNANEKTTAAGPRIEFEIIGDPIDGCACVRCAAGREAALARRVAELERELGLVRTVHAWVIGHRVRLIESNRELRREVADLRAQQCRIREVLGE